MKSIVLSYFHSIYGPKPLIQTPNVFSNEQVENVAKLMDTIFDTGFFIHKFSDITTANYFFQISSPWARGNKEMILISVLFNSDHTDNLSEYEVPLKEFTAKFMTIQDIYQSFYHSDLSKLKFKDSIKEKFVTVKTLVEDLYKALPLESVSIQGKAAKLFIFGLDRAGKTTLLNRIKDNIFIQTNPTLNVNIMQIILNNMQIVCFDVAGQKRFRNSWRTFMNATNGLIFVFDCSDLSRIDEAREELFRVLSYKEAQGLPLLIFSNKIDIKPHGTINDIIEGLHLHQITDRDWKIFDSSALNNIGVDKGFSWISKQILKNWAN
ncbi:MAG: ADP-ribosylation factor family protein, partial [Candidatus Helarchaeota archaeon]